MVYAYSHFCLFVGQETMRRTIPTSSQLEGMMYDHFSSNESTPLPTTPFSPGGRILPNRKDDTPTPTASEEPQGFLSWVKRGSRKGSGSKDRNGEPDYFGLSSSISIDFTKLYNYSTKDLFTYAATSLKGNKMPFTSNEMIASSKLSSSPTSEKDK